MQTFMLKPSLSVSYEDRPMRFIGKNMNHRLIFKDEYGETITLSTNEFYKFFEARIITIDKSQPHLGIVPFIRNVAPDLGCYPKPHSAEALRRQYYIKAVISSEKKLPSNKTLNKLLPKLATEFEDIKGAPSAITIRRWYAKYQNNSVLALVPKHSKKGRPSVFHSVMEDLLLDVLNSIYLKPESVPITQVHNELERRIIEHNRLRLPSEHLNFASESSVRRYINKLDQYEVEKKKSGKHTADKKFSRATAQPSIGNILDRWEIDHTLLDVMIIDSDTGQTVGRPYLTIVIDRYSRMIMAYWIHFSAPNTESVLCVIQKAITPKASWLSKYPKVKNDWPAQGLPLRIVPDNAAEFHANNLILAFSEMGIEIMFPPSRCPQMKGAVERFFRTLNTGLIHTLPGTTFSNVKDRGDYPSEARASLTLKNLEAAIIKWIVDIYHQTPHKGLSGQTPMAVWKAMEPTRAIQMPADLDALETILSCRKQVLIHPYGIQLTNNFYHSDELADLRMQLGVGTKVQIRYRDELGHIWVHNPARNVFFEVPAKDKRLIGMSRDLFITAKKIAQAESSKQVDREVIVEAYHQLREDIKEASHSNKLRARREAAKRKHEDDARSDRSLPAPETPSTYNSPLIDFDSEFTEEPFAVQPFMTMGS
jgi:putative transposase